MRGRGSTTIRAFLGIIPSGRSCGNGDLGGPDNPPLSHRPCVLLIPLSLRGRVPPPILSVFRSTATNPQSTHMRRWPVPPEGASVDPALEGGGLLLLVGKANSSSLLLFPFIRPRNMINILMKPPFGWHWRANTQNPSPDQQPAKAKLRLLGLAWRTLLTTCHLYFSPSS